MAAILAKAKAKAAAAAITKEGSSNEQTLPQQAPQQVQAQAQQPRQVSSPSAGHNNGTSSAGARLASLLAAKRDSKLTSQPSVSSNSSVADTSPASATTSAAPAATSIAAIRIKLARAAMLESIRQTKRAHDAGTLPLTEEIEADITLVSNETAEEIVANNAASTGMHGEAITYNAEQQRYIDLAVSGESCVLIGAAGTGKTTCSKGGISGLIQANKVEPLSSDGHKYLLDGTPGIIIISYTRRAVNNIRKVQEPDMKDNCITSHKLLEYQPEYFEVDDPNTGTTRRTMQFLPARTAQNPLPSSIGTIVVEEASMLSVELYTELVNALSHPVQWIFIGDIQQLPPVFGSAILGFKMVELPVVELTQVYRQALESPIIRLAHRILSGKPIPATEYESWNVPEKLTIHPWKKRLSDEHACLTLGAFFKAAIDKGVYNPDEDIILIPYNKGCGTIELNNIIANFLARKRQAVTYEIMAGFNKHYYSAGDRILYDREDAEIVSISKNSAYSGARVQPPSANLDYWGHNPKLAEECNYYNPEDTEVDVDFLLDSVASTEDRVTQASHTMVVRLLDTEREVTLSKSAEINSLLLSYALTVHKSQGSEWRKVFFCLHNSHATMLQRELVYTGVTRAREELYIICEPDSLTKGIVNQKIKGNTLAEKAEFFKGKMDRNGNY